MVVKEDVFDFSDFDFSGFVQGELYKNAISAASSRFDYWAYREEFNKAAELAKSSSGTGHKEAFCILADLCGMVLYPELKQNPFKPMLVLPKGRSMLPEDLSEQQVSFLGGLIDAVDDVFVKARLGELLWLVEKPKNRKRALTAIDSYLQMPLSSEAWFGVKECWVRAIVLSKSLRDFDRVYRVRDRLFDVLLADDVHDAGLLVGVARLLRVNALGSDRTAEVAAKLASLISKVGGEEIKRDVLEEGAEWYAMGGASEQAVGCIIKVAESYERDAENCICCGANIVAIGLFEMALKKYKSIPSKKRVGRGVDDKIKLIRIRRQGLGADIVDEMKEIRHSFDVTEFVSKIREAVSSKDVFVALLMFASGNQFPGVKKIRGQAIHLLTKYPVAWLFSSCRYSSDGRLLDVSPCFEPFGSNDGVIERATVDNFRIYVDFHSQAFIYPALMVLRNEHWLSVGDFECLARESPIVPCGRERMWAIGLHAGYEGDFVVALHVLVPQIENMVRVHLKAAGVSTSIIDPENLESEKGLGALVQSPEAVEVFGADLLFELKYLLCSRLYKNIRNEMAHGLFMYEDCYSPEALYCWWLAFRLMFAAWWNSLAMERQKELVESMMKGQRESSC